MLLLIFGLVLLIYLIYKLSIKPILFWNKLGVPHTGWIHFFKLNWLLFFGGRSVGQVVQETYYAVPNKRYHGVHQFNHPQLVIRDPELIKEITIKDFDHFSDRRFAVSASSDPLFGSNLLHLTGQKWRVMRSIFSASFTTNKLKLLFQIMDNCGKNFVQYFIEKQKDLIELEMQDSFTKYTNDVIAGSVFGAEIDSLREPNNEFYLRGKQATDFVKFPANLKFLFSVLCPPIYKMLGLQIIPPKTNLFFRNLVKDTIKLREEGKITQTDMMKLMIETKKEYDAQQQKEIKEGDKRNDHICITDEDVISQAFIFFFGGFETVARSLCFMAYELAVNQDIQQKLREEVENVNQICNQKITYDILMGMKYLDMVVSEVLRKYPVQVASDRVCTKPYTIEPKTEDEAPGHIPVGTLVFLPTYSIHHDPEFFPNPEKFDPERFSDENKPKMKPYAYQPFGGGPRMCVGSRFALMEIKLLFYHLLNKFEIVPIEKTKIPLVYKNSVLSLSSEFGFWLGLKRIEHVTSI